MKKFHCAARIPVMAALIAMTLGIGAFPARAAHASAADADASPALVPAPARLQLARGSFTVSAGTPLLAEGEAARAEALRFAALLARTGAPALKLSTTPARAGAITFALDDALPGQSPERYRLRIDAEGVRLVAADARGLHYGAVTLWQLLSGEPGDAVSLPALVIDDAPRFGWRGLMLDSARHFQGIDEIKSLLDAMALHKLNTFHWHLTDDQGWRIEIRKYPKLTEIGGCRLPAGDGAVDPASGQPRRYCGHYTQEQIREVVAYAAERHITVVPEIDVPGHATAAIAAYPALGVVDTPLAPTTEWGVFPNLFNVEEATFRFLEDVLAEVVELFPGRYVHVGGDEAIKDQWQASARVQQRMRELGAADEMAMQSHLIRRLEKFLSARGRQLVGWDEILEGGLAPQATVMSWRGIDGGLQAARMGHDVVMAPSSDVYLDYLQTDSPNEPPGRPGAMTLRRVYEFEPVPAALEDAYRPHILGVQANVWTEHMRSYARVEHAVFPRIAAVAETGWSPAARRDYRDFLARLPAQLRRYRALGIGYARTPFEVRFDVRHDAAAGRATVALGNALDYPDIRYTLDGRDPGPQSPAYRQPLALTPPVLLKAAVFADGQALAPPSALALDPASAWTRADEALESCAGRLVLRLEDDGPVEGERAVYDVDIFDPCWRWKAAPLQGVTRVRVRAGRIPYYFRLAHDEPHRRFAPARSPHGEMDLHAGNCDGPRLASVPLPAAPGADGFVVLDAEFPAQAADADLCIRFTGDTRPRMWVLDQVTLQAPQGR